MNPKTHIGDGKLPNRYWVFHYDEKFIKNHNGEIKLSDWVTEAKDNFLGEFKTYKEALDCANINSFYPHVLIEDRITGIVFETMVIICPYCGHEEYETFEDIKYTREFIEKRGFAFK